MPPEIYGVSMFDVEPESRGTFPVPMFIPRYTCRLSTEIISPSSRCASSMAKSDLPEAVGPAMIISFVEGSSMVD